MLQTLQHKLKPFYNALFLLLLLAAFFNIGLFSYLNHRPAGMHQWAQCDRASVALNFYQQSMNIFLPRTHYVGWSNGICGMEFPLMNWLAAMSYQITGFHEMNYRILMLAMYVVGLFAAFRLAMQFTQRSFSFSFFSVMLFCLSPVLCFYAPNFIPDTAALSLTLIAWYYYFTRNLNHNTNFFVFVLVLTLAAMIKITALISCISIVLVCGYSFKFLKADELKTLKRVVIEIGRAHV